MDDETQSNEERIAIDLAALFVATTFSLSFFSIFFLLSLRFSWARFFGYRAADRTRFIDGNASESHHEIGGKHAIERHFLSLSSLLIREIDEIREEKRR